MDANLKHGKGRIGSSITTTNNKVTEMRTLLYEFHQTSDPSKRLGEREKVLAKTNFDFKSFPMLLKREISSNSNGTISADECSLPWH